MSYSDTSFVVQSTYTYIHGKQVYDQIASQLSTHGAWQFVESVDFVSGTAIWTTYVWKNLSSVSGMLKDWHVGFRTLATSGVQDVLNGVQTFLFEDYNSTTHTASKYANKANGSAVTLNADASHPGTWVLTAAYPNADPLAIYQVAIGSVTPAANSTGYTALRGLITVSNWAITGMFNAASGTNYGQFYIGGFDSILGATLDPLPLTMGAYWTNVGNARTNQNGGWGHYATTRHPSLGGVSAIGVNCFSTLPYYQPSSSYRVMHQDQFLTSITSQNGAIGNTGDTGASMWTGVPVGRVPQFQAGNNAACVPSLRGGFRGFLKHWGVAYSATHTMGDTFTIDGVAYVGWGAAATGFTSLLDTTA